MSLLDFLYRCPACGQDPIQGEGSRVNCPACRLEVDGSHRRGTRLAVRAGQDAPWEEALASELADAVAAHGGARTRAMTPDGRLGYQAEVRVRTSGTERPIHYSGLLLGFAERFGAGTPGILHLQDDHLHLLPPASPERAPAPGAPGLNGPGTPLRSWALEDIRALQGSSSTVQITTGTGGVTLFRFTDDSPRRWDELLRFALNRRWEALGKGTIAEFQPRIRTHLQLRHRLRLGSEHP